MFPFAVYDSATQQRYVQQRVAEQRRQREVHETQVFDSYFGKTTLTPAALSARHIRDQHSRNQILPEPSIREPSVREPSLREPSLREQCYSEESYSLHTCSSHSHGEMEQPARLYTADSSSGSSSYSQTERNKQDLLNNPFEIRHGRRHLRQLPYPLPVDVQEVQRQNLRTLLCCEVLGRPICSPKANKITPMRVLELGCGSGYWSAKCHDYFAARGHKNVSFTGLDIAPLAPDLRKQGVNWTFVQHDLRRIPYPFEDESFDLVMMKDMSLVLPSGRPSQSLMDESIRLLVEGGTLEIWDSDFLVRSLLPPPISPPVVPPKQPADQEIAQRTATFPMSPGTPFTGAGNRYLVDANLWIEEALDRRRLPTTPCTVIHQLIVQEEELKDFGVRRVAIPLGEMRWERESGYHSRNERHDSVISRGKGRDIGRGLTAEQAALRHTALLTVLHMIESLEPLLKEASGKDTQEWGHWWASMMTELLDPCQKAPLAGECLEIGAWWATKAG